MRHSAVTSVYRDYKIRIINYGFKQFAIYPTQLRSTIHPYTSPAIPKSLHVSGIIKSACSGAPATTRDNDASRKWYTRAADSGRSLTNKWGILNQSRQICWFFTGHLGDRNFFLSISECRLKKLNTYRSFLTLSMVLILDSVPPSSLFSPQNYTPASLLEETDARNEKNNWRGEKIQGGAIQSRNTVIGCSW